MFTFCSSEFCNNLFKTPYLKKRKQKIHNKKKGTDSIWFTQEHGSFFLHGVSSFFFSKLHPGATSGHFLDFVNRICIKKSLEYWDYILLYLLYTEKCNIYIYTLIFIYLLIWRERKRKQRMLQSLRYRMNLISIYSFTKRKGYMSLANWIFVIILGSFLLLLLLLLLYLYLYMFHLIYYK